MKKKETHIRKQVDVQINPKVRKTVNQMENANCWLFFFNKCEMTQNECNNFNCGYNYNYVF